MNILQIGGVMGVRNSEDGVLIKTFTYGAGSITEALCILLGS